MSGLDRRPGGGLLGRVDGQAEATSDDRSRSRHGRIALASAAGVVSRGLSAVALVIGLRLAEHHLSPSALGVWSLLVSAVALLGFADLGLGNGLVNVLTDAVGRRDADAARRAVSAASAGLLGTAVVLGLAAAVAVALVPWASVLKVAPSAAADVRSAVAVFAAMVVVAVPATIGQRIHVAYQQGWAAATVGGVGSVISLVLVAVAAAERASLAWFVAAMLGGTTLASLGETVWVLARSHPDLRPTARFVHAATLRALGKAGFLFFVLATAGAVAYQTDVLIVSNRLGAVEVTRYVVSLRLFLLAPTAVAAMVTPLWPAYGEAIARHDLHWVRATLRRSMALTVLVTVPPSLVLLVGARPLLRAWAPSVAAPPASLLWGMTAWAVVSALSTTLAMYFNGANIIRFQVVVAVVMAVSNLTLSIVLVGHIGLAGPIWGSVISQTIVVLGPELVFVARLLRLPVADGAPGPLVEAR